MQSRGINNMYNLIRLHTFNKLHESSLWISVLYVHRDFMLTTLTLVFLFLMTLHVFTAPCTLFFHRGSFIWFCSLHKYLTGKLHNFPLHFKRTVHCFYNITCGFLTTMYRMYTVSLTMRFFLSLFLCYHFSQFLNCSLSEQLKCLQSPV